MGLEGRNKAYSVTYWLCDLGQTALLTLVFFFGKMRLLVLASWGVGRLHELKQTLPGAARTLFFIDGIDP